MAKNAKKKIFAFVNNFAKLREILFRENVVAWFVSVGRLHNNVFFYSELPKFLFRKIRSHLIEYEK
jgi:hypothetical protein